MFEPPALVTSLHDLAMMREPVEERRRHFGVAKDTGPFGEGEVGGDDDGGALVKTAHQMEEQLPASLRKGQIAQLVQDHEVEAGQVVGHPSLAAGAGFAIEPVDRDRRHCRSALWRRRGCRPWRSRWQDGFCRCRSRQRHNAGCPAFEVRILYPFHPRAGELVQVEHRKRFAGEDHLVVVQPDGTLALIPSWMSEETARSATLSARPRLPVERLVELRVRIDALLASRSGEWPPREGGDHATKTPPATGPVREGSQDAGYSDVAEGRFSSA